MCFVFTIYTGLAQENTLKRKEDSLQLLLKNADSLAIKIDCYKQLLKLNKRVDKYKELSYLLKIKELYKIDNNEKSYSDIAQHIGWFYIVKIEKPDSAEVFLAESLKIAHKLKDTMLIGKGLTYTGIMYQRKGYYKTAMTHFLQSLPYKETLNEPNRIAFSYNLIGEVYAAQEEFEKSLSYHFKALELRKSIGDNQFHIAHSFINISKGYYGKGNYKSALQYGLDALKIYKEVGGGHNISKSYNLSGNAYLKLQKLDSAIYCYKKSLKIYEKIKIIFLKIEALNGLASAYLKKKDNEQSKHYANLALSLSESHQYANLKKDSYRILSESHNETKSYKKSICLLS